MVQDITGDDEGDFELMVDSVQDIVGCQLRVPKKRPVGWPWNVTLLCPCAAALAKGPFLPPDWRPCPFKVSITDVSDNNEQQDAAEGAADNAGHTVAGQRLRRTFAVDKIGEHNHHVLSPNDVKYQNDHLLFKGRPQLLNDCAKAVLANRDLSASGLLDILAAEPHRLQVGEGGEPLFAQVQDPAPPTPHTPQSD